MLASQSLLSYVLVTTGVPCGVTGMVVVSNFRVVLQLLLVTFPRASVVVKRFALASNVAFVVTLVGATVLVS
jgi:hypothetical protein